MQRCDGKPSPRRFWVAWEPFIDNDPKKRKLTVTGLLGDEKGEGWLSE